VARSQPGTSVIVYEPHLCTGCRYCEIACAVWHCGEIDVTRSRIRILFDEGRTTERYAAVNCQHCDDAICCAVCPSEALQKDEKTGWVTQNSTKCVGCEMCILACPLSVPIFDAELKVAVKCDFCLGAPECVKYCSSGALRLCAREEAVQVNARLYLSAKDDR
jgi:anaerobic carbon-monoxide dehydrogenase iron sulfur subunit